MADDAAANTTAIPLVPEYFVQAAFDIGLWSNTFIFIIGLVTNPILIYILTKKTFCNASTKILLTSMTIADLGSVIAAIFINYIPYYWKWFNVFSGDLSCGVANMLHGTVNTMSSWYLVLLCAERMVSAFNHEAAKELFSVPRTVIACVTIPIFSAMIYSVFILFMGTMPDPVTGYILCVPKSFVSDSIETATIFKVMIQIWVFLYMFLPAGLVITFNSVKACKLYQTSPGETTPSKSKKTNKKEKKSKPHNGQPQTADFAWQHHGRVVTVFSLLFAALVIPRGISVSIFLDANWTYSSKAEYIFDVFSYILQYLNHSTKLLWLVLLTSDQSNTQNKKL